jgi:hypothetical protein
MNFLGIPQDKWAEPAKKTFDTLPHTLVTSVELLQLETITFQKCMHMKEVLFNVIEHIV